ncbi:MAG TPA: hypothetical protein VNO70_00540 [Blastocatellia bacterium]|nr:hypothetical protein [Blastocatellia bacterium]
MSAIIKAGAPEEVRVIAGHKLVLRVQAYDPSGIAKIMVQCFQFSMASTTKAKLAVGELVIAPEESFSLTNFDITVPIPENAALGKWGVQLVEFTNGKGYKSSFYRGQGKFDNILFEVIPPPSKEIELLCFNSIEIAD